MLRKNFDEVGIAAQPIILGVDDGQRHHRCLRIKGSFDAVGQYRTLPWPLTVLLQRTLIDLDDHDVVCFKSLLLSLVVIKTLQASRLDKERILHTQDHHRRQNAKSHKQY